MKAVIKIGGKQYIVAENQKILVDHQPEGTKDIQIEPLMVFDKKDATVGTPVVKGATVTAEVTVPEVKGDKIRIMKFKAKKREQTLNGFRAKQTEIKIKSIVQK